MKDRSQWTRWFAWFPVTIYIEWKGDDAYMAHMYPRGMKVRVWLRHVERRYSVHHMVDGYTEYNEWFWEYRYVRSR